MKDAEHLLRIAVVFVMGLLVFFSVRAFFVPRSFGEYGHYRGDAIAETAALPIAYAGHQTCEECHSEVLEVKRRGKHAGVACEACHGPQAKHTEDPVALLPRLPDSAVLCPVCHEASSAKPKSFPQVDTKEHSGGLACNSCHKPHDPSL